MADFNGFNADFAGPAQFAEVYRKIHWQVVPSYPPKQGTSWKRPMLPQWTMFQRELVSDEVWNWWYGPGGQFATHENMGIITGACSGNTFVIDLDTHKDSRAEAWWRGILAEHNSRLEPETVEQVTGGGGRQLMFRAPPGYRVPTRKTGIGVDIRGDGGFAVTAPSLHESGRHYAWCPGRAPWEIEVELAPAWLLEEIEALVDAHGGDETDLRQGPRSASPGTPLNEFGSAIDDRESIMRDVVWRAVLELYRQSTTRPADDELVGHCEQAYAVYEGRVANRRPEHLIKAAGLEADGRGPSAFRRKWAREMRHWGSPKMEREAAKPAPEGLHLGGSAEGPKCNPQGNSGTGQSEQPVAGFELLDEAQILALPDPVWLVDGMFAERSLGFIYGPPGSLKTFGCLDLGMSIANQCEEWWGRRINRHGAVIYIMTEGKASLKFRLMAWRQHRKVPGGSAPFYLLHEPISFMNPADIGKLLVTIEGAMVRAGCPVAAIFVDTVSRVLPGAEENQQKDMTLFIGACDAARNKFDTVVFGIHHSNKEGGFRGSTVMPGAGDFMIEVRREPGAMAGSIFAKKIKDAEDGWEQGFRVHRVQLGDFALQSSLVLDHIDGAGGRGAGGWPHKDTCRQILAAIDEAWNEGDPWSASPQAGGRFFVRILHIRFRVDAKMARTMLDTWLVNGTVRTEMINTDSKKKGLKVTGQID